MLLSKNKGICNQTTWPRSSRISASVPRMHSSECSTHRTIRCITCRSQVLPASLSHTWYVKTTKPSSQLPHLLLLKIVLKSCSEIDQKSPKERRLTCEKWVYLPPDVQAPEPSEGFKLSPVAQFGHYSVNGKSMGITMSTWDNVAANIASLMTIAIVRTIAKVIQLRIAGKTWSVAVKEAISTVGKQLIASNAVTATTVRSTTVSIFKSKYQQPYHLSRSQ